MVSFTEAVRICLITKIFNWHDRAPRSEYWWFILFCILASIGISLLFVMLIQMLDHSLQYVLMIGAGVFFFYLFWAGFMVSIRRLHDKNMRGWWLIFLFIVQFIGAIANQMMALDSYYRTSPNTLAVLMALGAGIVQIIFFVLFVTRGTVGYNRFGPDPIVMQEYENNLKKQ